MGATLIRDATQADVPRLVEMGVHFLRAHYKQNLAENPAKMQQTVGQVLDGKLPGRVLVAENGVGVVGMIVFIVTEHHFSGDLTASEMVWWVEPTARGRTGLDLLHEAERQAREMGAKQMHMISPSEDVNKIYRHLKYELMEWGFKKDLHD